jgi:Secretion system C-terminal sorting domain
MKKIFLIAVLFIISMYNYSLKAQTCNITSTGLSLLNNAQAVNVPSIPIGGIGYAKLVIVNFGSNCSYPAGVVHVQIPFVPAGFNNHFYKYAGPPTFNSVNGKIAFTYDAVNDVLNGTNILPFSTGIAATEFAYVRIEGVKATPTPSSIISDITMQVWAFPATLAYPDLLADNYHNLRIDVAGNSGTVPIVLGSFESSTDRCDAILKWTTSNEESTKAYELETSIDGVKFDFVGTVKVDGSKAGSYELKASQPSGKSFYRLKMMEKDGSIIYSKIITALTNCNDKTVKVFPNPVKLDQKLNVYITGYDVTVKGDLYSATGQFVKSYVLKNGSNTLSVENLAQGFYTLRVSENGSATETIKINVLK